MYLWENARIFHRLRHSVYVQLENGKRWFWGGNLRVSFAWDGPHPMKISLLRGSSLRGIIIDKVACWIRYDFS